MKEFKGRVIAAGNWEGEAAVSKEGFNYLNHLLIELN